MQNRRLIGLCCKNLVASVFLIADCCGFFGNLDRRTNAIADSRQDKLVQHVWHTARALTQLTERADGGLKKIFSHSFLSTIRFYDC